MKNCLFEGIITSQEGSPMKKGKKALKYADLCGLRLKNKKSLCILK